MRFVPPVAALADGPVRFDGDPHARERPMAPVVEALRALGVEVDDGGRGALPFTVRGTRRGPRRRGRPSTPRRPASSSPGCCWPAPASTRASTCTTTGEPVPSQPHIEMTVEVLRDAGVRGRRRASRTPGGSSRAGQRARRRRSSRTCPTPRRSWPPPLVTGGRVHGAGLAAAHHPGRRRAARHPRRDGRRRRARPATGSPSAAAASIHGVDLDLHDVGELTPVVAALARPGRLAVRGCAAWPPARPRDRPAGRARDRDQRGSAGTSTETEDGLRITPRPLHGGLFHTYDDHRMAMAGAVHRAAVPGVVVEDVATTAKTLPEFPELWPAAAGAGDGAAPDGATAGGALRRERRPHPAQPARDPPAHQGPPRARGRRARAASSRVDRGRYTMPRRRRRPTSASVTAMKARELGRKGVVVGDGVAWSATPPATPTRWPGSCGSTPRRTVLRRTADDTDPVERVIVANADQLVVVTALADPEPRPRLIDRCLVAAYDAGHGRRCWC